MVDVILLCFWLIAGVLNLCSKEISKLSYFLAWIVVIAYFASRVVL